MSAEVESLFLTRKPAWHNIGKVLEYAPTSEDAIVAAGLDWKVEKHPIIDKVTGLEAKDQFLNVRDKDSSILGVVSGRYEIVQNIEAFSFTDSLVDEGLVYESAGSLKGGKCVFLLGKLPKTSLLGEDLEPYICFTNTFDGSGAIQVCCTHTRVVCMNTLNLALKTAKRKWSTRHIGDMQSKLKEASITLGLVNKYTNSLQTEAERLAEIKVFDEEVEGMLDLIYPVTEEDSDIRKKRVRNLKDNFFRCLDAPDIRQYKNTAFAVVMAATDYADHGEPMRKTKDADSNRWFQVIQGHPFVDTIYKEIIKKTA